jgi:hypothetical protein
MKPPLRIAVLECDTPLDETRKRYGSYGGVFTALLNASADALGAPGLSSKEGLEISSFHVQRDQAYPAIDEIDAVLITGSRKQSHHNLTRKHKAERVAQDTTRLTTIRGS